MTVPLIVQLAHAGGSTGVWPGQVAGIVFLGLFVFLGIPVMLLGMRHGPNGRN